MRRSCFCRGSRRVVVTLLSRGVKSKWWLWLCFCRESKSKEWPRPCFCRGSSAKTNVILHLQRISISTNSNNGDFASAGSRKNKWRPRSCFCRGSSAKTNVILHLQMISISTNSNNGDFASAGSRENKWRLWLCFCRESENNEWPRPCFCRGSSAKTNVTLLLQGVNISKLLDQGIIFY